MRATLRVEDKGRVVEIDLFEELFDVEPTPPPALTELQWRKANPGTKPREVTLIPFDIKQEGRQFVIHYTMKNDISHEKHTFRIPSDNLPFIGDAVEQGVFELEQPYRITMEQDGKVWRWIKMERI